MSDDKTRQGKYSFDGFGINRQDAGGHMPRFLAADVKGMVAEARLEVPRFCQAAIEAGAIQDETGLSPRQLLEQRDVLKATLKILAVTATVAEAHMDENGRKRFAQELKARGLQGFDGLARFAIKAAEDGNTLTDLDRWRDGVFGRGMASVERGHERRISLAPAVKGVIEALRAQGWLPFGFREEPEVRAPENLVTRRLVEGPMKRIGPQGAEQELDAAVGAFSVYFHHVSDAPLETGCLRGVHFGVRDGEVEIDGWHADFNDFGNAVMMVVDGGQEDQRGQGR